MKSINPLSQSRFLKFSLSLSGNVDHDVCKLGMAVLVGKEPSVDINVRNEN